MEPRRAAALAMTLLACADRGAREDDTLAYRVTVVSVEAESRRPDGRPWDETADGGTPVRNALCSLVGAGALAQGGALGAAVGTATRSICASMLGAKEGGSPRPEAPDLQVEFRMGDRIVRTPVATQQFVAKLEYPFLVTQADRSARFVRIHVVDVDGKRSETMASLVVPIEDLTRPGPVRLHKSPGLRELSLLVDRVKRPALRREETVRVYGSQRAIETDVVVLAGQRVTLKPADEICTRWFMHEEDVCAGPEGTAKRELREYNIDGFGQVNHLALLALIGGEPIVVGAGRSFEATASGNLVFFVNDTDVDNNRGEFRVGVVVE